MIFLSTMISNVRLDVELAFAFVVVHVTNFPVNFPFSPAAIVYSTWTNNYFYIKKTQKKKIEQTLQCSTCTQHIHWDPFHPTSNDRSSTWKSWAHLRDFWSTLKFSWPNTFSCSHASSLYLSSAVEQSSKDRHASWPAQESSKCKGDGVYRSDACLRFFAPTQDIRWSYRSFCCSNRSFLLIPCNFFIEFSRGSQKNYYYYLLTIVSSV